MELQNGYFQARKSSGGKNPQSFRKVMEMCHIHLGIYADFK